MYGSGCVWVCESVFYLTCRCDLFRRRHIFLDGGGCCCRRISRSLFFRLRHVHLHVCVCLCVCRACVCMCN